MSALVLVAGWLLAAAAADAAVVDPDAAEARPWFRTEWYGVYAGEAKVGWMRRGLERAKPGDEDVVVRELAMLLDVAGDGSEVTSVARTVYPVAAPQAIAAVTTEHVEQGRTTRREVVRREGRMDVVTVVRGERAEGSVGPLSVTLADELAAERLAAAAAARAEGPVGATLEVRGIDLGTLTESRRVLTVSAARTSPDGKAEYDVSVTVAGRAVESFTTDGSGVPVRGALGPRFTYRREHESKATDPTFRASLESLARIPLDRPLGDPAELERVVLAWEAPTANPFVASPRQVVRRTKDRVLVEVLRDADSGPATPEACAAALRDEPGLDLGDPMIREGAARLVAGAASRAAQVAKLLAFVRDHLNDEVVLGTLGAGEALRRRRGDCTEHARLFTALCRAAGLPAREVSGLAWLGDARGAFGRHTWAEVAIDGKWRPVDPTTGQNPADAGHVALEPSPQTSAALLGAKFVLVAPE